MENVLMPRDAGRLIAETSKDVTINDEGVQKLAKLMYECVKTKKYTIANWKSDHELNPSKMTKAEVDWVFVADTLNFSFWSMNDNEKFKVTYKGTEYTGYWSWVAALNRALDNGIPLTDPSYYASVSKEELCNIFKSDTDCDVPLLEERLQVLQEAGKVLLKKYDGSFVNCIEKCGKSAQTLLKLVVTDFQSYRDETEYNGKQVAFYKRAQILIADIWACFEGKNYGEFHDIDTMTMFADYRIPQALAYFDAMLYSKELTEYMKADKMMKTGDRYEMEIRGCSIWATELVCEEAKKLLQADAETKDGHINSIIIDHYLWDYRRDHADDPKMADIPFHKIRCIYY
ncbi:queuosine salvage protein-like [Pecten maximus]|uniref:queuosine salvage protein-like n=1 Tax=Pecten maximus TaxID=6579 RepID=UPI00145878BE|nr:queuosine salvage protein-like [Pecten maximus]XP_033746760.1 queuosine salvage protein-like [Pecten maximus]XP_033746761.1 queuosine salvage protein-like [Pecten maximus]XP_033746762.1 queuosine salvage protein-like [Pecten maximus]XP_033746763.1 queuosine salvage protein-like [Pecten maximus]XP_033746764.1 queuosine salvage protein-like [Pecten maximus]